MYKSGSSVGIIVYCNKATCIHYSFPMTELLYNIAILTYQLQYSVSPTQLERTTPQNNNNQNYHVFRLSAGIRFPN